MSQTITPAKHRFHSSCSRSFCGWCGLGEGCSGLACKVTLEMRWALATYQDQFGKSWRTRLIRDWDDGKNIGTVLETVRQVIGPRGLKRIPAAFILES